VGGIAHPFYFKIMNELAALVSDVLTGNSFVNIELNGEYYTVEQPNTIVVARMLKPLSNMEIKEGMNFFESLESFKTQSEYICEAISIAVLGDVDINLKKNKDRLKKVKQAALKSNFSQIKEAFTLILSVIDSQSFFECAHLAVGLVSQMSKQKEVTPLSGRSQVSKNH